MSAIINGINVNTTTAERVIVDPAACRVGRDLYADPPRFDEVLYRNPQGWYFIVRPLDPQEAEEWMRRQGDEVMRRRHFPDEASD